MSVGDLARYLMVSRQNLAGLISRMERDGHIGSAPDGRDRRSRLVTMTASGCEVWMVQAQPKIHDYCAQALDGFSSSDLTHTLHYLPKLLDNKKRLDAEEVGELSQEVGCWMRTSGGLPDFQSGRVSDHPRTLTLEASRFETASIGKAPFP